MKTNMFPPRNCIAALFLLALPAVVQAQFIYITNNGALTITGYTGPGGTLVIPDATNGYAVTGIGDFAFEDCTNLTGVTIPGSVTNVGVAPFLGCSSLTNISVNATNPVYASANGVLVDEDQFTLIQYPDGLTNETYVIPNGYFGVTNIGPYAFASCANLKCVTYSGDIGRYVYSIGDFAFSGCTGLTSVTITNTSTSPDIGEATATSIGAEAFSYCTSLTKFFAITPVADIGGLAFAFCTNLTAAYFPSNAPPDVGNAFDGDPDAIVYYMPGSTGWGPTFGGAPTAEETFEFAYQVINGSIRIIGYNGPGGALVIPSNINGYTVTIIGWNSGQSAFGNLRTNSLTSIVIPDTVTNILPGAFENCRSLTNIVIPGSVTSIGEYAFDECESLSSVFFLGNAPSDASGQLFLSAPLSIPTIVYYLPGTTGWGTTFGGAPTELWNPQATAFTTAGGQFGFNITGPTNATIVVESCTNLSNPVWLPVSTNTLSGSGTSSFSDLQQAKYTSRYYRFSAP